MNSVVALAGEDHEQPIRDGMSCNAGRTVLVAALADDGGKAVGAGVDLDAEDRLIACGLGLWLGGLLTSYHREEHDAA
jgi:hypothetical protein